MSVRGHARRVILHSTSARAVSETHGRTKRLGRKVAPNTTKAICKSLCGDIIRFPPLSESLSEVVIWAVWGSITLTLINGIAVSLPGSHR
jgi:hypothetical protein